MVDDYAAVVDLWRSVVAPEHGAVDATLLQRMTEAAAAAGDAALAVDMLAFAYGLIASLSWTPRLHLIGYARAQLSTHAQIGTTIGGHGLARPGARGAEQRRAARHASRLQAVAALPEVSVRPSLLCRLPVSDGAR